MTTISLELSNFLRKEYLSQLSASELAYWLVHSFSPDRYRDPNDVVEFAVRLMYVKSRSGLADEFVMRLWGMFGLEPDHAPNSLDGKVVSFRRVAA